MRTKKKIMIVTTNFPPSTSIGTQRILKVCKFLSKSTWEVHALTLKEKFFDSRLHREDRYINNILHEIKVVRTSKVDINSMLVKLKTRIFPKKNRAKTSPLSLISKTENTNSKKPIRFFKELVDLLEFPDQEIAWVPFAIASGYRIIKKNKIDVIFSSSPRHSCHLTTMILKYITGKKLIIEFRDPWARSPWHETQINQNAVERIKHKCIQFLEKRVVQSADRVILVTNAMQKDFQAYYKTVRADKFSVFYNGYDSDVKPAVENRSVKKEKTDKPTVFSHIGSLYKERNPEPILRAVKQLVDKNPALRKKLYFQFIGGVTNDLSHVRHYPEEYAIKDIVTFVPKVSFLRSLEYMTTSDILILLQPVTKLQLPAKFFDYINMRKIVLAVGEKNSEVEHIVSNRFGIFADYNDTEDIANAIKAILHSTDKIKVSMIASRPLYSFQSSFKNFEKIIEEVLWS